MEQPDPGAMDRQLIAEINACLLHDGPHEPDFGFFRAAPFRELPAFQRTIIDLGANCGQAAVSFRKVRLTNPILSFEANPLFGPVLEYVKTQLSEFDFRLLGASDQDGRLVLLTPVVDGRRYHQESSLFSGNFDKSWVQDRLRSYGESLSFEQSEVRVARLDQFGFEPSIIKVDVEGGEVPALTGLRETISRCRPVIMVEDSMFPEVTALLAELGYDWFKYSPEQDRLVKELVSYNTLYIPREQAAFFSV